MIRFRFLGLFCFFLWSTAAFCSPVVAPTASLSLYDVRLSDLARIVFGDLLKRSYQFDSEVIDSTEDVTVNWLNLSLSEIERQTRMFFVSRGYELLQDGRILKLRKLKKDDEETLFYIPRYRSARYLSDILGKVAGAASLSSRGLPASPSVQASIAAMPEVSGSASSVIDKSAVDQITMQCLPAVCDKLRKLLVLVDTPELNVIIRAVVYEVATSKSDGSALQVAASLFKGKIGLSVGTSLAGASVATLHLASLDVIASVLDTDSRFSTVARPSLRVKTGNTATFSVGSQTPVLGALSTDKNGNALQSVEYRTAGTIFTVSPDIRGDVIDLTVSQELSSFAVTSTGVNNSPTLLQRMARSTLSLHDGEVVVFAGLEESKNDGANTGLFGHMLSSKANSSKSEVLLFIEAQRI